MIYAISKMTRYRFGYVSNAFHKYFTKILKKNWLSEELGLQGRFRIGTIEWE